MGQVVEVKTPLAKKDYENMLNHADSRHLPVFKTRRCFLYNNQQYQLDIYRDPCHPRCRGLMLLETFTTLPSSVVMSRLPEFLTISKEVTGDPAFSMYNLALRSDWVDNSEYFCHLLVSDEEEDKQDEENESEVKVFKEIDVLEASRRLAIISADNSTDEASTASSASSSCDSEF